MKWVLLAVLLWVAWRMLVAGRQPPRPVPGAGDRPVVVIDAEPPLPGRRWLLGATLVGAASVFPLAAHLLLFTHGASQVVTLAVAIGWAVPALAALMRRVLVLPVAGVCAVLVLAGAGGLQWLAWSGTVDLGDRLPAAARWLFTAAAVVQAVAVLRYAGWGARR
ncbi:hypothetical protein [Ideonella sp.]|uniref:hypothetical protein n=1 Tax=Ideonella sp. TaxID=1929293 RepID=UPI0035B1CF61